MFESKEGAYRMAHLPGLRMVSKYQDMLHNLAGTSTLAYFVAETVTKNNVI